MRRFVLVATSVALTAGVASGNVIFDQIGADESFVDGNGTFASQFFESGNEDFNIAALDEFEVSGGLGSITQIEAVIGGWNGFEQGWDDVDDWTVQIYSSVDAAGNNLDGDMGSVSGLAPVDSVSWAEPHSEGSRKLTFDVAGQIPHLADGTYWLAVVGVNHFGDNGQIGVRGSDLSDGPGSGMGHQANPNGGFGFGPWQQIDPPANLAYRIHAVVPAPGAIVLLGLASLAGVRRRRN